MSYTYTNRRRTESAAPKKEADASQPSMDALRSGAAQPTAEQMGHRVDLPDAMRTRMEEAFGADLGAVKLYESQAVADAGAKAMTRGANIAFAPGMLDFTSFGGQSLLGHEISHVVSQARGEVTGSGFLSDRALEARADAEGAMAASGQTVAMPTAALSPVTAAAAAGPMQAKDKDESPKIPMADENPLRFVTRNVKTQDSGWRDKKNYKLYQQVDSALVNRDPSSLRNKALQDQVAAAYTADVNSKRQPGQAFKQELASTWRPNSPETATFSQMLTALAAPMMGDVEKAALADYKGPDAEQQRYEAIFSATSQMVNGSEDLQNMIAQLHSGFEGSQLNEDEQGETVMNSFFLRAVTPYFQAKSTELGKTGKKGDDKESARYREIGTQLQALTNSNMTGGAVDRGATQASSGRPIWRSEALRGLLGMGKGLLARGRAEASAAAAPAPFIPPQQLPPEALGIPMPAPVSPPQQLPPEALNMPAPAASATEELRRRRGNR